MKTEKDPKDRAAEEITSRRKKLREVNEARCKQLSAYFEECRVERIAMMRKRHAFLSEIVKDYETLENFAREKREYFEMMGIEFDLKDSYISLYFNLGYNEYEQYYVEPVKDGGIKVSQFVDWQNEVCANERLNIFT